MTLFLNLKELEQFKFAYSTIFHGDKYGNETRQCVLEKLLRIKITDVLKIEKEESS